MKGFKGNALYFVCTTSDAQTRVEYFYSENSRQMKRERNLHSKIFLERPPFKVTTLVLRPLCSHIIVGLSSGLLCTLKMIIK